MLDEDDVAVGRVQLGVEDGFLVGGDGQPGVFPRGTVFEIEHAGTAMGCGVEEIDAGFGGRVQVIDAVINDCPIAPVTCLERADDLDFVAAAGGNAPQSGNVKAFCVI